MKDYNAPRPPRSCLNLTHSPIAPWEIDGMRSRAWREQGVAVLPVADILDPWLRQAITNEATRRWGPRPGGDHHGR